MLRDLVRSQKGRSSVEAFVRGEKGIRSLINETQSERLRRELYRLERSGVATARRTMKQALKKV